MRLIDLIKKEVEEAAETNTLMTTYYRDQQRIFVPCSVVQTKAGHTVIRAWEPLKQGYRSYRLDRIWSGVKKVKKVW